MVLIKKPSFFDILEKPLSPRLTAGQQILVLLIEVRILGGQHKKIVRWRNGRRTKKQVRYRLTPVMDVQASSEGSHTGSNPVLTTRSVNPQVLGNENCQMSPSKLMTPRKDEEIVRWRIGNAVVDVNEG